MWLLNLYLLYPNFVPKKELQHHFFVLKLGLKMTISPFLETLGGLGDSL